MKSSEPVDAVEKYMRQDKPVIISLDGITYSHRTGEQELCVLKGVTLDIVRGQSCAIVGSSGSGKSTLLNILGLLSRPDSGQFHFVGRDMCSANSDVLASIRNQEIGFIFQSFNLLSRLTALDNVALPLSYRGISRTKARQYALQQLQKVGLEDRATHLPSELSGGQCQRVAIARALVGNPSLILADEPTGNLDSQTAAEILDILLALNREQSVTLIVVTHDIAMANHFDRKLEIRQGEMHEVAVAGGDKHA
ncbi:ABC transporter ATP-binding protein [Vreelandella titanicae]|uniref:ABC transporter ATP-binding protein n=1 Tax=Vreelandella titanicae TaxID=664683 RepID=UPI001AD622C0|nr:ABC transporter ATP-binding protein [Halomonas titanicae]